jgi:hypothetical protein
MSSAHVGLGIAVLALFSAAGLWGAWCWWRVEPSRAFWALLRAAQAALVAEVALGAVLLIDGRDTPGDLHLLYGLLPVAISFVAEQLRLGSADAVLATRGLEDAQAVGRLPAGEQRSVVTAIVQREMGVTAVGALVCAALVARAAFV